MAEPQPVPTPTPTPAAAPEPSGGSALEWARMVRDHDLIGQLRPVERAKVLQLLAPDMKQEQKDALRTPNELAKTEPRQGSFVDGLMAPIFSSVKNPGAAAENAAIGVASALNPQPLISAAANPILGKFGLYLPDDLATFTSLANFPLIRGSELAARMFVPEGDRPSLTTFADVVNDQRDLTKKLAAVTPGVQEGTELGTGLASMYELAGATYKYGKEAVQALPGVVKNAMAGIQEWRAGQAAKKAVALEQTLVKSGDAGIIQAILKRPEKVQELAQSGNLSLNDLSLKVQSDLGDIREGLGKTVGEFRDMAFADNKTRMQVPPDLGELLTAVRQRTTFQGESVLPAKLDRQLQSAEKMAKMGVTTPNQAMVWVDTLDGIVQYGAGQDSGSNSVRSANNLLATVRGKMKSVLRENSDVGEQWALADDAFSRFLDSSQKVQRGLNANPESLVANLFGKNKTQLRSDLEDSLNFMEYIDPTAQGHGKAFFDKLDDIRAAQKLTDVPMEVNRVVQQRVMEIQNRWTRRGERVGEAAGAVSGGVAGHVFGNNVPGSSLGGGAVGYAAMKAIGGEVGAKIGAYMSDTDRILESATKAKELSTKARQLAGDMRYLVQNFGPQSSVAFLDLVGPVPAVNELTAFANTRARKGNDNGK